MTLRSFVLLALLSSLRLSAQGFVAAPRSDTLAMVDGHPITAQDLFERIAMMPYEDKTNDRDFASVKKKAVESLVGEYLLSQFPAAIDTADWRRPYSERTIERMFMRDALFRREIREKVRITEQEIVEGMRQIAVRKVLLLVYLPDGEQGKQFVQEWKEMRNIGAPHHSFLKKHGLSYDTVYVTFDSADSSLRAAAFQRDDSLTVTGPVRSSAFGNVAVAWLRNELNPEMANVSIADRRKSAIDKIRDRKETELQRAFFDNILRGQTMTADTVRFFAVARSLRDLMLRDTIARKEPSGIRFLPTDLYDLQRMYRAELDSPIVRGTFGSLSLGMFLEHLYYYDFTVPSLKAKSFVVSFFQMLRTIAEGEMVAAEAEKRNMRYDAAVRHDMQMWNGANHAQTAQYRIADTVYAEEWEPYWSLWRRAQSVIEENIRFSVQEVLLADSASAVAVKNSIERGASMDSIARAVSRRKEWKQNGGRSGWFAFREKKELSQRLMMTPVNTLSGPYRTKEGFSVVTLLGRSFSGDAAYVDSLVDRERLRMRTKRQIAAVNRAVAENALQHRVEFFEDRIRNADVPDVNMLTRRILGFGGRINAAPYLSPQWEWVDLWNRMKKVNP